MANKAEKAAAAADPVAVTAPAETTAPPSLLDSAIEAYTQTDTPDAKEANWAREVIDAVVQQR